MPSGQVDPGLVPALALVMLESGSLMLNGYRTSDTRISIGTPVVRGPSSKCVYINSQYCTLQHLTLCRLSSPSQKFYMNIINSCHFHNSIYPYGSNNITNHHNNAENIPISHYNQCVAKYILIIYKL